MKVTQIFVGSAVGLVLLAGIGVMTLRPGWLKPREQAEDERAVETDVPVRTAKVTRATLRRYVEGYGAVEPEPAMAGKPSAGAALASPLPGMVAAVLCEPGQVVAKDAVLIQLDDRLATAQEEQAIAALESAQATLAKVKSMPRPEQSDVARLTIQKAKGAADLAERNFERQRKLGPEQVTSAKAMEAAENELNAARGDLQAAEKQWALLKPSAEELAEAIAKVREAEKALAVARVQRALLKIQSPVAGTIVRVPVNQGEAVDPTKVLVEVVAMDRLAVNATVSARGLGSLKIGQAADVRVTEAAGTAAAGAAAGAKSAPDSGTLRGAVKLIGYQVDRKVDTVQVWVSLPPDASVRPGEFARVSVVADEHADKLAVPLGSLVTDGDGNSVIAVVKGERATRVKVQPGLRDRDVVEIEGEGVTEGDAVVTEGAYGLPNETKVHVIGG
jgi:RND family efflux transporter MFP subunit